MERFTLEILIWWRHVLIKNTEKYDVEKVPIYMSTHLLRTESSH